MIFSKDKKPTEPGWWWAIDDRDDLIPQPRQVWRNRHGVLVTDYFCADSIDETPFLWGDRIELPPVSGIEAEGR